MRLPVIDPNKLSANQKPLFDELHGSIERYLEGFVTHRPDGTLIGPFNALLHFPNLGQAAWSVFLALNDNPALPPLARKTVILLTGARFASIYEIYSHEASQSEKDFPIPRSARSLPVSVLST
jgi:4-carboxymuconolactone decarboxylase